MFSVKIASDSSPTDESFVKIIDNSFNNSLLIILISYPSPVDESLTWSPVHQTLALLTAVVFIRVTLHICTGNKHETFIIKLLMFVQPIFGQLCVL